MRLLVVSSFFPPHHHGGYELRCKEVIDGLLKNGHEIKILTRRCPDNICNLHNNETGIQRILHERTSNSNVILQIINDKQDLHQINYLIRDYAPDLIYLWDIQNLSNTILPYFSTQQIPIIYDEGGSGIEYLYRVYKRGIYFYKNKSDSYLKKFLKNVIYKSAKLTSCNLIKPNWTWPQDLHVYFNCYSAREHALLQGVPVQNASVIHSGIDIAKFPFKNRLHVNLPIKIIIPGRIKSLKGDLDGISLLHVLAQKNIPIQLIMLGEIQDKDYFANIIRSAEQKGLRNQFFYQPMVDQAELSKIYRQCDFCFFPSYFKSGFSRVPLEAMASGCAVITYGNEGSNEIIEHEKTGIIVAEGDVSNAALAVQMLINRQAYYNDMIQKARLTIESKFGIDNYINTIEAYLLTCLVERNRDISEACIKN